MSSNNLSGNLNPRKSDKRAAYSSYHMNGNLVCAIDIETTGLQVSVHDILQIAVIPLGPDLKPSKQFTNFFHMKLKPKNGNVQDAAVKTTNALYVDACINGIDAYSAEARFAEWFESLKLPPGKKIVPLGCNYLSFDQLFIMDWLGGQLSYQQYFRSDVRDCMLLALSINDMAEWRSDFAPFGRVGLKQLANYLKCPTGNLHDAIEDALLAAEVYRRLLTYGHDYQKIDPDQPTIVPAPVADNGASVKDSPEPDGAALKP